MVIEQFLQGKFEYEFSDLNMESSLVGRGITLGDDHSNVSEKQTDLAMSDLYMILANVTNGGGRTIVKGNRTVREKSYSFGVTDRLTFRNEAIRLRTKWGEVVEEIQNVQFITFGE
jgi:hypothetical protein